MRYIILFVLFLPLAASAQKTDTAKREKLLKDYSVDVHGGYGTGNLYSASIGITANFRKINYKINAEQSILRRQTHDFYMTNYRAPGIYYYNFGMTHATSFPETFSWPNLNRLTKKASGSVSWEPAKKIKIDLSGSYTWTEDTVGFSVARQVFTGNNFRKMNSLHYGGLITERKRATLEFKYPGYTDNCFIKFRSEFTEEKQDITLRNSFADATSGYVYGFIADASNRDINNKVALVTSASLNQLWLPWVRFDDYRGLAYKRKSIWLTLAHTYRMERGVSHLFTRTDIVPENGPTVAGSDRFFYTNYLRPSNEFSATLYMSDLVKIEKPKIEIDYRFLANHSEQPWTQNATRIDASGANPEDALYIRSVIKSKLFTHVLSYSYKHIGFALMGQSREIVVLHESGETISKRRFMVLPQLEFIFLKTQIEYSAQMLSPGATDILTNPDWRNPSYLEYGNPSLELGVKHQLNIYRDFYKIIKSRRDSTVKYSQRVSLEGFISRSTNRVMWIAQPDSAGILYARPVNLPYLLNTSAGIDMNRHLFPSMTVTAAAGHSWLKYDYPINDTMSTMNSHTFGVNMTCGYQPGKKLMVKVRGGYTLVHTDYTGEKQFTRSYQSFDASLWFDVKFFDQLRFYITGNAVHYLSPQEMENKSIFFVSSFVEWSKPKGRLSVHLAVNDLFNQNIYFTRNDAHGMVQQISGVAAGRYAMLSASWGISKK